MNTKAKLAAISDLASAEIRLSGRDFCQIVQPVEIKEGRMLTSTATNGRTPDEAIEAHWKTLTNLRPDQYLVVHAGDPEKRRAVRWNGSEWAPVDEANPTPVSPPSARSTDLEKYASFIERLSVEDGDGYTLFCEILHDLVPHPDTTGLKLALLWSVGGRIDAAIGLYRHMLPEWGAYGLRLDEQWGSCGAYVEEHIEAARFNGADDEFRGVIKEALKQANHPSFAILMALLRALRHKARNQTAAG